MSAASYGEIVNGLPCQLKLPENKINQIQLEVVLDIRYHPPTQQLQVTGLLVTGLEVGGWLQQVKSRSGDDLKELLAATTIVKALQSLHSEQHQLGREWINPLSQSETHKAVNWRML